ncbi:hypothetical protein GQ42DRAFT_154677 [Ramicandelaber brevisporus]|nr:hypothetical protein GQ42DRAFT_154677 [Ramicandelaber brevisporus]
MTSIDILAETLWEAAASTPQSELQLTSDGVRVSATMRRLPLPQSPSSQADDMMIYITPTPSLAGNQALPSREETSATLVVNSTDRVLASLAEALRSCDQLAEELAAARMGTAKVVTQKDEQIQALEIENARLRRQVRLLQSILDTLLPSPLSTSSLSTSLSSFTS